MPRNEKDEIQQENTSQIQQQKHKIGIDQRKKRKKIEILQFINMKKS